LKFSSGDKDGDKTVDNGVDKNIYPQPVDKPVDNFDGCMGEHLSFPIHPLLF
jgi:hypothetical protein